MSLDSEFPENVLASQICDDLFFIYFIKHFSKFYLFIKRDLNSCTSLSWERKEKEKKINSQN